MSQKHAIGDRVMFIPNAATGHIRPGIYTVVRALPLAGQSHQYRIKSAFDRYERVVDEAQLDIIRDNRP